MLSDDLLFGSRLQANLTAAGHEVTLGPRVQPGVQAVIADLTHVDAAVLAELEPLLSCGLPRPPVLAFYAHVEPDVRERALAAGVDRVLPRSRVAREAPALLAALLATER